VTSPLTQPLIGRHPQSVRYYFRLVAGTFRTMLDVGMLAVGSALVALAVAVVGDAFDVFSIGLPLSTSSRLGSSMVVFIVGAFALGIASEGGYGAPESVRGYPALEIALGRLAGSVAVGLLLMVGAVRLTDLVAEFSLPIRAAHELVRAAGTAGATVVPLIGVPLAFGIGRVGNGVASVLEMPLMYVVWALATLSFFVMPAA